MYRVIIASEEVAEVTSLAKSCQIFVCKINEMKANGYTVAVLKEMCMIEAFFYEKKCTMDLDAVMQFAIRTGMLDEAGRLTHKPLPQISTNFERAIFIGFNNKAPSSYLAGLFSRIGS